MGIRMATDLNLHRKTSVPRQDTPEGRARDKEVHNRERTWLYVRLTMVAMHRSHIAACATFLIGVLAHKWASPIQSRRSGSPSLPSLWHSADTPFSFIIRNASQWWRNPAAIPSDSGIVAYVVRVLTHCAVTPLAKSFIRKCSVFCRAVSTSCIPERPLHPDYIRIATTCSLSRRSRRNCSHGIMNGVRIMCMSSYL